MSANDLTDQANTVTQAIGRAVTEIFNCTPPTLRPVAMAALRSSAEAAVQTFDAFSRALYDEALANMETVAIKGPKGGGKS